eukprot:6213842-Pleurochrysis_carterae.AAC.3
MNVGKGHTGAVEGTGVVAVEVLTGVHCITLAVAVSGHVDFAVFHQRGVQLLARGAAGQRCRQEYVLRVVGVLPHALMGT